MSLLYELPLLGPLLETLITVVAPFLVVLSIVVFVHELGHYLVGKWCGIKAEVFSIGFGRELGGWTDKAGTRWRVALLPLGGYVKFKGDADAASAGASGEVAVMSAEEKRATLTGAPLWAKAATIIAGPAANFLLTFVLVFFLTFAQGVPSAAPVIGAVSPDGPAASAGLQVGDRILEVDGRPVASFVDFLRAVEEPSPEGTGLLIEREGRQMTLLADLTRPAEITDVVYGGPADIACIAPGDVVVAVGDTPVRSFADLREAIEASEGAAIDLMIERGGESVTTELAPRVTETMNPETRLLERRYMIGVVSASGVGVGATVEAAGIGDALSAGVATPLLIAQQTFGYIGAWIIGEADGSSINSLIGIANTSGEAASLGLLAFIYLIALISAAIGLMNLLPIPILDGGHLVFYTIEAIRGRPLNDKWMEVAMTVGLAAVLLLMVFATANDISPWLAKMSAPSC